LAQRIGEEKLVATRTKAAKPSDFSKVIVDTTCSGDVAFPTDARLMHRARELLSRLAKRNGVTLRQSYARVGKRALIAPIVRCAAPASRGHSSAFARQAARKPKRPISLRGSVHQLRREQRPELPRSGGTVRRTNGRARQAAARTTAGAIGRRKQKIGRWRQTAPPNPSYLGAKVH
jgi:hypothetical protein